MTEKNDDKALKETLHELALMEMATGIGAEELKVSLNEVIQRYSMAPASVLAMLARLTAGYIHVIQEHSAPESHDEIEDKFRFTLDIYLADMDLVEVSKTMEKVKQMEAN